MRDKNLEGQGHFRHGSGSATDGKPQASVDAAANQAKRSSQFGSWLPWRVLLGFCDGSDILRTKLASICSGLLSAASKGMVYLTAAYDSQEAVNMINGVDAQNGQANIESNLVIRCAGSSAGKRAGALGEMGWEVKVGVCTKFQCGTLCKPLWWRYMSWRLGLAAGSFGRCLAPRKCVFLRHGRRRGCLVASRFDAGSARFIMV
ncbi:hypothetical protein L3X38_000055 [Prunus dulcis]|uniref:Uncharacterized protein n=1 Tax=Prunus dulcis TaxID=3755 RepID=A0AAD4UQC9_PRUDU|nr:hypothetical protein L3X38_000055 [Prunus dulcis]